jgi:hypothetical protein
VDSVLEIFDWPEIQDEDQMHIEFSWLPRLIVCLLSSCIVNILALIAIATVSSEATNKHILKDQEWNENCDQERDLNV